MFSCKFSEIFKTRFLHNTSRRLLLTLPILSLSEETPCYKEILNKYFVAINTSSETASKMSDERSLYPGDLLDFKEENALCDSSSAISFISITGPSYFKKFSFDVSLQL